MSTDTAEEQRRRMLRHAETCDACGELVELHQALESTDLPQASASELREMRRGVLRNLRNAAVSGRRQSGRGWRGPWLTHPLVAAFSAVFLLLLGFAGGRVGIRPPESAALSFTGQIERAAARSLELNQSQKPPFVYSNVRLQAIDTQTVRLGFDVTTHLDLVRSKDDPLVADVLVQSLVGPASLGTRLDAIDMVGSLQPRVRQALVAAMLDDPSLAVRLKAISKLTASGSDPATREALLEVLRSEDSVTMRLLAIDHLTSCEVSASDLRAALEQGRPEPGTAVYVKAEKYLRVL